MGVDFDKILAEVGGKGKYQMIRYFLLAAIPIAMSWHLVGMFHLILLVWPDPNKMNCGWKLIVVRLTCLFMILSAKLVQSAPCDN